MNWIDFMATMRSVLFTAILFLSVGPHSLLILIARPFGTRVSYAIGKSGARAILWLCKILCGLDYMVEGRENFPTRNG